MTNINLLSADLTQFNKVESPVLGSVLVQFSYHSADRVNSRKFDRANVVKALTGNNYQVDSLTGAIRLTDPAQKLTLILDGHKFRAGAYIVKSVIPYLSKTDYLRFKQGRK